MFFRWVKMEKKDSQYETWGLLNEIDDEFMVYVKISKKSDPKDKKKYLRRMRSAFRDLYLRTMFMNYEY